jgi:hypothetical protein
MPALMTSTPACLVTSVPEFDPPTQTAPQLVTWSALPDVREVLEIKFDTGLGSYPDVPIEAEVISEDVNAEVLLRFYIDYGIENAAGQPFFDDQFAGRLPAATLADGPRKFSKSFRAFTGISSPGCHTLTLIASHRFAEETSCPTSLADSSQLTWRFVLCPDQTSCIADALTNCAPGDEPLVSCPESSGNGAEGQP